ncbi:MAG TPA: signal peptidase II [Myxococcota bacterium]|nr:MAG: Lipoprotein signal peptidase [Deltaproteobacteria bacterium ADurb.Bin058]HQC44086.1 signal peptidase II [Myxococcota bacterium]
MKDKPEAEVKKPGINRWLLLAIVTVVGFVADLATKLWALANISLGELKPVFGNVLGWTLTYNKGALFGFNPANWIDGFPTRWFYVIFTIILVPVLVFIYSKIDHVHNRLGLWGMALLVPGAAGNFLDRVLGRPGVVDFIRVDLGFPPFNPWPIFNVADAFITVGIALVFIDMIRSDLRAKKALKESRKQ